MADFDVAAFIEKNKDHLSPEEQKELRDGYLRNSDYHAKFNAAKVVNDRRQAAEDQYHAQLEAWEKENKNRLELAAAVEQRLGVPLSSLVQSSNPAFLQTPAGDYVSKSDLAALRDSVKTELLAEMGPALTGTFHLAVHMPRYAFDYQTRYGKMLDGQAFVDFCRTNHIEDADLGYKLYTAEDEKKHVEDQHKKDLDRVREETTRQVMSQHHIPEPSSRPPLMRSPLMRSITPPVPSVTLAPPAPASAVSPAPAPVPAAVPLNPGVPAALAAAPDLAARMQHDFLTALPK